MRTAGAGRIKLGGSWQGDLAKGVSLFMTFNSGEVIAVTLNPMETLPGAFQGLGMDNLAYRLTRS